MSIELLERVARKSRLTLEDAIEIGRIITRRAYEKIRRRATMNLEETTGKN